MNFWNWFFPKKEVAPEMEEIEVAMVEESEPEPDPILMADPEKGNGFDARATAAEEALAEAMAEMEADNFEERVQNISMGTESLSQEQVQSILKNSSMKSKPI